MPESSKINYRERATNHLAAARAILEANDDTRLLYACLELRLTIEALAYDVVQMYRSDLSDEVLQAWQADKLLREVAALDPGADGPIRLEIEGPPGGEPLVLVDYRMTSSWARKAYPQLGSFLHERTLLQIESGKDIDGLLVRDRAEKIALELDRVISSNGFNFMIRFSMKLTCDCGGKISLSVAATQAYAIAACPACGSSFEFRPKPGGDWNQNVLGVRR